MGEIFLVDIFICIDDGFDVWVGDIIFFLAGDIDESVYIIKAYFSIEEKADSGFINGVHDGGHKSAGFTAFSPEKI